MKKKYLLVMVFVSMLTAVVYADNMESVSSAANAQFRDYLHLIPEGMEKDFGFLDREEFDEAALGKPHEVFMINEEGKVVPFNVWRVPIIIDGKYRSLLSVKEVDGEFKIVAVGASRLARELCELESEHYGEDRFLEIENCSLLRSFTKKADFIVYNEEISDHDNHHIMRAHPLDSAHLLDEFKEFELQKIEEHESGNGIIDFFLEMLQMIFSFFNIDFPIDTGSGQLPDHHTLDEIVPLLHE
ncbi:MAG: hypothetical protein GY754_08830 [bacterium]|nr:hypothetical protein [bacterium]